MTEHLEPPIERVIEDLYDSHYVIECPNCCKGQGCQHDGNGLAWRKSKRLPVGTTLPEAVVILQDYADTYPKSGPYRLVRRTTKTITETTIFATTQEN